MPRKVERLNHGQQLRSRLVVFCERSFGEDREFVGATARWVRGEDSLVLFTDGVVDARNGDGERFGEERVLECVRGARREGSRAAVAAVFAELGGFAGEPDDRSVLVLNA